VGDFCALETYHYWLVSIFASNRENLNWVGWYSGNDIRLWIVGYTVQIAVWSKMSTFARFSNLGKNGHIGKECFFPNF